MWKTIFACIILAAQPLAINAQTITIGGGEVNCTSVIEVPIVVNGGPEIDAFGLKLEYDPSCLDFIDLSPGFDTADWGAVEGVENTAGVVTVGGFKAAGLSVLDFGELAVARFACVEAASCECTSEITAIDLVDDIAGGSVQKGSVTCTAGAAGRPLLVRTDDFAYNQGGWFFVPVPPYEQPYHEIGGPYSVISLRGNNTNAYGYFSTEPDAIPLGDFDPMADSSQTGQLYERQGPHYLVRYWIRRTTVQPSQAVTYRTRVNSANGEEFMVMVNSAAGDHNNIPDLDKASRVDFVFQPSAMMYGLDPLNRSYRIAFDIMGFDASTDMNGGYLVDYVEVWRIPLENISTVRNVATYDFSTQQQRDDWMTATVTSIATPTEFSSTTGKLEFSVTNPAASLGIWQNEYGTITTESDGLFNEQKLFFRMKTLLSSEEANPYRVPLLRPRLMPTNFNIVMEHGLAGVDTGTLIPSLGNKRIVYNYLELKEDQLSVEFPRQPVFNLHTAIDAMSFEGSGTPESGLTSTAKVAVELVEVDIISISGYPENTIPAILN